MKNDVVNDVSDADGMTEIWRKYTEKILNVKNEWDGAVGWCSGMVQWDGAVGWCSGLLLFAFLSVFFERKIY